MRFRTTPADSRLFIEAKSTLHPIHTEASGLVGEADVEVVDGRFDLGKQPRARLTFPVERLRSGNGLQDMEMLRRVDAKKYPEIVAELRKAVQKDGRYRITADLTFHGVTRRLELEANAGLEDGGTRATLESQFTLDVRSFDVTPPSFLGRKVHPEVRVRVRLVLVAA
jgi:polyisoprenoid-binding protein YceI